MKLSTVYKLLLLASVPRLTHKNNRGVTLIELIVGVIIGGILIQLAYFAFSVNRGLYLKDAAKNNANQNLRTVFEVVGPTITQAGEGIGTDPKFPVIDIRPFPSGSDNSKIVIRQLKSSTKLRLCENIAAGAEVSEITVLKSAGAAGCDQVDDDGDNYPDDWARWKSYREINGGSVEIFIYDGNGVGESLTYTGEKIYDASGTAITGTPSTGQVASASIFVTPTTPINTSDYSAGGATQLLILEEQGYQLDQANNTLQAIVGGDVINLISDVGQFTVTATVRHDGALSECTTLLPQSSSFTCSPALTETYSWSQIDGINVTSKPNIGNNAPGLSTAGINNINNQLQTQTFYPRNLINF